MTVRQHYSSVAAASALQCRSAHGGGWIRRYPLVCRIMAVACAGGLFAGAPSAAADTVAYLVNVTVRPGYNFPNADAALAYGREVCTKIATGERYADLIVGIQHDFNTDDPYHAAYLVNQASNEPCPEQIWRLRQLAGGYTGPAALPG